MNRGVERGKIALKNREASMIRHDKDWYFVDYGTSVAVSEKRDVFEILTRTSMTHKLRRGFSILRGEHE